MDVRDDLSEEVQYNFPSSFSYIRKKRLSQFPNYVILSHWHDDLEFVVVLSGSIQYDIAGQTVSLQKREGLFINSRQLHGGFSADRKDCEFICALLHPLLLCATQQIEREFVSPLLQNSAFSFWKLKQSVGWEEDILRALRQMYFHPDPIAPQLQIQSLFYQMWGTLYRHAPREQLPEERIDPPLSAVREMVGYIQCHYKEKITLDDIALAGKVCRSSCCSLFRHHLNQTPVNYLIHYRLEKSLELMRASHLSISEIGYEVGFSGASYFAEAFRKHYGCNPTAYRSLQGSLFAEGGGPPR